jgi:hypothetical protein
MCIQETIQCCRKPNSVSRIAFKDLLNRESEKLCDIQGNPIKSVRLSKDRSSEQKEFLRNLKG